MAVLDQLKALPLPAKVAGGTAATALVFVLYRRRQGAKKGQPTTLFVDQGAPPNQPSGGGSGGVTAAPVAPPPAAEPSSPAVGAAPALGNLGSAGTTAVVSPPPAVTSPSIDFLGNPFTPVNIVTTTNPQTGATTGVGLANPSPNPWLAPRTVQPLPGRFAH